MKVILITILLVCITIFGYAEIYKVGEHLASTESPDQGQGELKHITFYGILDVWETQSGSLVLDCLPPFLDPCFTLFWNTSAPGQKTVVLTDFNQTEISVNSDPVVSTGENGAQINFFTR